MATTKPAYRMKSGYAFELQGEDWQGSPADDWDTVVHTAKGDERFIGLRYLDGMSCCVFLCRDGRYRAQLTSYCM